MQQQRSCPIHGHECHQGLFSRNLFVGQRIPLAGVAHQNGTIRFGDDPATSALDRELPGARGGQPLRGGRQLLPLERRGEPGAHHHGQRAAGGRPHPGAAGRHARSATRDSRRCAVSRQCIRALRLRSGVHDASPTLMRRGLPSFRAQRGIGSPAVAPMSSASDPVPRYARDDRCCRDARRLAAPACQRQLYGPERAALERPQAYPASAERAATAPGHGQGQSVRWSGSPCRTWTGRSTSTPRCSTSSKVVGRTRWPAPRTRPSRACSEPGSASCGSAWATSFSSSPSISRLAGGPRRPTPGATTAGSSTSPSS